MDWIFRRVERKAEHTDGRLANLSAVAIFRPRDGIDKSEELDSSGYLFYADLLCDKWKLDQATDMLRRAVRMNTNEKDVMTALVGIEAIGRFANYQRRGYRAVRLTEISCGMNGKHLMNDTQEFVFLGTEEEYNRLQN